MLSLFVSMFQLMALAMRILPTGNTELDAPSLAATEGGSNMGAADEPDEYTSFKIHAKKMYDGKEVEPVKVFPGNKMVARFKDNQELVLDPTGKTVSFKSL